MARECGGRAHENKGTSGTDTYTSLWTGAKNVFSPSSVVEYARLPAKTWGERSEGRVPRQRWMGAHLEARSLLDDRLLRSRRHAVLSDRGGGGVRHFERMDGDGLVVFRVDELVEPVSSCQTWGLRRKCESGQMPCFDTNGKLRS